MKTIPRVWLLIMLCVLPLANADAFWSRFFQSLYFHQMITADALSVPLTFYVMNPNTGVTTSVSAQFSKPAIDAINVSNQATDLPPYYPEQHFDSEELASGFRSVANSRMQLMNELAKPIPDQAQSWKYLGLMLHGIQDFYSHSSWIHNGKTDPILDIVNFGLLTENWDPTSVAPLPAPFNVAEPLEQSAPPVSTIPGTYCDVSGTTLTAPVNSQVITGFYDPFLPPPVGHCAHGSVSHEALNCGRNWLLASPPDGINHDSYCFKYIGDVDIFQTARSQAESESISFVQAIITDLSTAGHTHGICILLGLGPSDAPYCRYTGTRMPFYAEAINSFGQAVGYRCLNGSDPTVATCTVPGTAPVIYSKGQLYPLSGCTYGSSTFQGAAIADDGAILLNTNSSTSPSISCLLTPIPGSANPQTGVSSYVASILPFSAFGLASRDEIVGTVCLDRTNPVQTGCAGPPPVGTSPVIYIGGQLSLFSACGADEVAAVADNGSMLLLGGPFGVCALGAGGTLGFIALGINNKNQIVGFTFGAGAGPILYDGGVAYPISAIADLTGCGSGFVALNAIAIANDESILVTGSTGSCLLTLH